MSDDEKIVDGLLDCQKEVIARMALAGWEFVRHVQRVKRVVHQDGAYRGKWFEDTYTVATRNGKPLTTPTPLEDIYAAACAAEQYMFMSGEIDSMAPIVNASSDNLFTLWESNEQ